MPLRIIPEAGQGPEKGSEGAPKKGVGVLHEDHAGSKLANEALVFEPQAGAGAGEAEAGSGGREVLAGEAAAQGVDPDSIGPKSSGCESSNVFIDRHTGEAQGEDSAGEVGGLAKAHRPKPARAFQPEREAADPREEVEKVQGLRHQKGISSSRSAKAAALKWPPLRRHEP